MLFILASTSVVTANRFPSWEELEEKSEKHTREYLQEYPDVRSDLYVFKTITLPNGGELELNLRIERPKEGGPFPVVFYVHGGAWVTGSKDNFYRQSFRMASENGIAGVRMEYRWKGHGGDFDDLIGDVMDSIEFIRKHADQLNLDFTRVGIAGSSAGAHLGAIAAQRTPECIVFDGFNGLYDVLDRNQSRFGGDTDFTGSSTDEKKQASAYWNIREDSPDTWLYHGTHDLTIDWVQSRRFADKLRENGGNAELLIYGGYGHGVNRLDAEIYEATTQALLAHTGYVFGIRNVKPNPTDYIVNKDIEPIPEGFSLEGVWHQESNFDRTFTFLPDYSAIGTNGEELGWKKLKGRYYIVWRSGRLGGIKILEANKVEMASSTFIKDESMAVPTVKDAAPFKLVGTWRHVKIPDREMVFRSDMSAIGPNGKALGWSEKDGEYFIVWQSGSLGGIEVLGSDTIEVANNTYVKASEEEKTQIGGAKAFDLVGTWRQSNNSARTYIFRDNHTAMAPNGDAIGWKEEDGKYYLVWQSGSLGSIEIIDENTARLSNVTYIKD
ncbi:alpha/beta hydrolase [Cerasicoccus frondis]|uniref:alpha/beta hydrolase n=1 Tax=Cerasicoccus frondis TaxID=490090 RepID=UPI002852BB32|nr:alpha/beta hydrolase [Cerasicoccus frondis]